MIVAGIAFAIERWYKTDIREKLRQLKKEILWNDVITPFNLSYYTNCIVFYMLVDLRDTEEGKEASFMCYVLSFIIFAQPVVCFLIMRKYSMRELIFLENNKF